MTKQECTKKREIVMNLAHYLGLEIELPECHAGSCPEGECPRCASDNKILAKALLSEDITPEQRAEVRRKNINLGVYSFFSADDYDILQAKRDVSTIDFNVYDLALKASLNDEDTDKKDIEASDELKDLVAEAIDEKFSI